jgi:hypothetical protein
MHLETCTVEDLDKLAEDTAIVEEWTVVGSKRGPRWCIFNFEQVLGNSVVEVVDRKDLY